MPQGHSWVTVAGESPEGLPSAGQAGPCQAAVPAPGTGGQEVGRGGGTGGRAELCGVRRPERPVFVLLHFRKGKGACPWSGPELRDSLRCIVLFCFVL